MALKRKYEILTALTASIFLYVAATYISDGCTEVFRPYEELAQKKETALNPDQLRARKSTPEARKKSLNAGLNNRAIRFDESETGVFDFLSSSAQKASVRFQSLFPLESASVG